MGAYTGRFAPSPTGLLHAGSLAAALASWLDARAHHGRWLVRIEDVDSPRCVPGAAPAILQQLARCGLMPDAPPLYQSRRGALYQAALDRLVARGLAYACACSRQDIEAALATPGLPRPRHGERVYPGTCRNGLHGRPARAWRLMTEVSGSNWPLAHTDRAPSALISIVDDAPRHLPSTPRGAPDPGTTPLKAARRAATSDEILWIDRRLGPQSQIVASAVGDFVLRRADGLWAYQLAVVVDDAEQGVTDVVRGEDLADNTARQILLQRALDLPTPRYLHTPLVLGANGEKLSKQNGAAPLDLTDPALALQQAMHTLGLLGQGTPPPGLSMPAHRADSTGTGTGTTMATVSDCLTWGVQAWKSLCATYNPHP